MSNDCCHEKESEESCHSGGSKLDWLLIVSGVITAAAYLAHAFFSGLIAGMSWVHEFCMGVFELVNRMWWGVLLGILAVGVLSKIPREFVTGFLGRRGSFSGLVRATLIGVLLDLCSHGILLVGMQLYRRGASIGQTMAFLIASPWNSLSLTLILFALIGWKWTLLFIGISVVIALVSGLIFERLEKAGVLPENPNASDLPEDFEFLPAAKEGLRETRFDGPFWRSMLRTAFSESGMILRWILFGTVMAAVLRASIPEAVFGDWFGPTVGGLLLTLVGATIIEVCSEGSSPIAADLLARAGAPGNAFTFLMAGVATDYTEILSLRETTRSWKVALFLPLVTVPQIVLIGWLLNSLAR